MKNANYLKHNQVYMDYITEIINKINLEKNADRGLLFLKISSEIYNGLINFAGVTRDPGKSGLAGGKMDCLRCGSPMQYKGDDQLQLGKTGFFTGSLSN